MSFLAQGSPQLVDDLLTFSQIPWVTEGSRDWWKETGGDSLGNEVYVSLDVEDPSMDKGRLWITQHSCERRKEDPGHRVLGCC